MLWDLMQTRILIGFFKHGTMRKLHFKWLENGCSLADINSGLSMDFINDPSVTAYFSQRNAKVYSALCVISYKINEFC
jgi:hypothetical protein